MHPSGLSSLGVSMLVRTHARTHARTHTQQNKAVTQHAHGSERVRLTNRDVSASD